MNTNNATRPRLHSFVLVGLTATALCACTAAVAAPGPDATRPTSGTAAHSATRLAATDKPAPLSSREEPSADHLSDTRLGRAVAAVETEPRRAVGELLALKETLPFLEDVLEYYAALAHARYDAAAGRRELEDFLAEHGASVLRPDATVELARLVEASGDVERAISLAERSGRGGEGSPAAAVCLAPGRMLAKSSPARALTWLQCARNKAPLSVSARAAYDLVLELRRRHPELRPSGASALMEEAKLLGREGRSAEQAETLDELLTKFPGSPSENEAELAYGKALARAKTKSAGADFLAARAARAGGARKAKLLYESSTLYWNDDHNEEARAGFEKMLALKTGIGDEQQALYALARLNDSAGRREAAISYYGRAAAAARGAVRAESLWRQGWVPYRAKDYADAERRFAAMAENATRGSETDGRGEALYWQGRSLEKLGRKDAARALYEKVLVEFPVGYYAAAAEKRLGRRGTVSTVVPEPRATGNLPAAASIALRRATTLREAGLVSLAARDLQARLEDFDAATRRAVLPALPAAGAYDAAFRIAQQMTEKGQLSREEARPYFYPRAHADIVEREARKAGIDPTLVYALMRQESAFASTAVSPAKALGLMQLLESTARRVAADSGLPSPNPDDLFEPAVNIRLGVRYLAQLSKQFGANTALMAAAYNAGESAAARWQALVATYDEDEMIEQISYRETRGYVKSILRNMRNYRRIYGAALETGSGTGARSEGAVSRRVSGVKAGASRREAIASRGASVKSANGVATSRTVG